MIGCLRRTLPARLRQNFFWQPGTVIRQTMGAACHRKKAFSKLFAAAHCGGAAGLSGSRNFLPTARNPILTESANAASSSFRSNRLKLD